jgi:hypothetical protein
MVIIMAENRYRVHIKHPVYNELQLESTKQNKSIGELADLALIKYLETAFLKPAKKSRRSRLRPYNSDKLDYFHLELEKRIGIYDSAYTLLKQESQRTGKSIQRIATNAFIQYLQNINGKINTVDVV